MRRFEHKVTVPIFRACVILNVSDNVVEERQKHPEFGAFFCNYAAAIDGLCCSEPDNYSFGIFYDWTSLTHGTVAHEIFHLTHRIIHEVGGKFRMDNQEQHAYLNGWLSDWVYKQLKKQKVTIW